MSVCIYNFYLTQQAFLFETTITDFTLKARKSRLFFFFEDSRLKSREARGSNTGLSSRDAAVTSSGITGEQRRYFHFGAEEMRTQPDNMTRGKVR